jgi:uncharacterized protein (TIGR02646 family)
MKKIRKTNAPQELRNWIVENAELDHSYRALLGSDAHLKLKTQLLKEQGYLCAYTGQRIAGETSHVEHLKPQNQCDDGEDVDYRNMVACFPFGYGAPLKGGWWQAAQFISPLVVNCERHFSFAWSGHIHEEPKGHEAAIETIKVIGLDTETLRQLRRSRINGFFGFGYRSVSKPLSKTEAQKLLPIIDQKDHQGCFPEFCFAMKQLLPRYIAGGK